MVEIFTVRRDYCPEVLYLQVELKFPSLRGQDFQIENAGRLIRRNTSLSIKHLCKDNDELVILSDTLPSIQNDFHTESTTTVTPTVFTRTATATSIEGIEQQRFDAKSKFQPEFELLIRREHLVEDSLNQFDISNQHIHVKFVGEVGVDAMGISRSFFSDFWEDFAMKYGAGANMVNLEYKSAITSDQMKSVGRILSSGFILTGYIPPNVNTAAIYRLLSGNLPSKSFVLKSFCDSLDDFDRSCIEKAQASLEFDDDLKLSLVNILSKHHFTSLPSPETLSSILHDLSFFVSIVKPWYMLDWISRGINETHHQPLQGISEELFCKYMELMKPSGSDVALKLIPMYSDVDYLFIAEERVFGYLERFLKGASTEVCARFLKYVSGCELLCSVTVEFNSQFEEELMIPNASTCGRVLTISRYFLNQEQFDNILNNLLQSRLWKRFEVM